MQLPELLLIVYHRIKTLYLEWQENRARMRRPSASTIRTLQEGNDANSEDGVSMRVRNGEDDIDINRRMEDMSQLIQDMGENLNSLAQRVDRNEYKTNHIINVVNTINTTSKQQFDTIGKKFNAILTQMNSMENKFDTKTDKTAHKLEYVTANWNSNIRRRNSK